MKKDNLGTEYVIHVLVGILLGFVNLFNSDMSIRRQIEMIDNLSMSSVESQKGVIAAQRCSVDNQKGAIAVQSLWW